MTLIFTLRQYGQSRILAMTPHRSTMIGIPVMGFIYWLCCNNFALGGYSPMVHIKNGTIEGTFTMSRKGRTLAAFRGIPYAQPPLGQLRFEPPKEFGSWTGVRSAKADGNNCMQMHQEKVTGAEDCLYLNVYTPNLSPNGTFKKKYPVMIYIHGGAWFIGSAESSLYGPKFLLDHDVILVTMNYRLGALGFLSTEDLVSPGNQGLKDQAQAIRWVYENIAAFMGDPNQVTIVGQSAGGTSVHLHMLSPLSRGFFHRAISQSGSTLNTMVLTRPGFAKNNAIKLGSLLNCPTNKSSALVECLRKKNAADIIATDYAFREFNFCLQFPFAPVIEPDHPGAFCKKEADQHLKSGDVADVPWMTGLTTHEGSVVTAAIYRSEEQQYVKLIDEKFMEFGSKSILLEQTCPEKNINNVTKSIRKFYMGDKNIDESTRWNVTDMYTDAFVHIGTNSAVRYHLAMLSSPVYYYHFAYRGSNSFSVQFDDPKRDHGVAHGDDLQYLFPLAEGLFSNASLSEEDFKMIEVMTGLWVNFAKSGNPTPDKTREIPVKWKPVRTSNLEYLHIGNSTDLRMADKLFQERVDFWASIPHRGKIKLNKDAHHNKDEL